MVDFAFKPLREKCFFVQLVGGVLPGSLVLSSRAFCAVLGNLRKFTLYPKGGLLNPRKFTLYPKAGLRNPCKFTLHPKAGLRNPRKFTLPRVSLGFLRFPWVS